MALNWTEKANGMDTIEADDFNNLVDSIEEELGKKVNQETGKVLSSNDFTDLLKEKLESNDVIKSVQISDIDDEKTTGFYKVIKNNVTIGYLSVSSGTCVAQYYLQGIHDISSLTEATALSIPIKFRYFLNNIWTSWNTISSISTGIKTELKKYADDEDENTLKSANSYTDQKNSCDIETTIDVPGPNDKMAGAVGGVSLIKLYANGYPTIEEGSPLGLILTKGETELATFSAPVGFGGNDWLEFDPINAVAIDWYKDGQWYQDLSDGLPEPTAFLNKMAEATSVVLSDANAEYPYAEVTYRATVSAKLDGEIERAKAAESEALTSAKSYADTKAAAAEESAKTYGKQTFAGALKGEELGGIVRLDDVSALDKRLETVVSSKNIIPFPYVTGNVTKNGVTFTVSDDGSITMNGTATADTQFNLAGHDLTRPAENGGTYVIKGLGGSAEVKKTYHFVQDIRYADGTYISSEDAGASDAVFTVTGEQKYLSTCYIVVKSGTVLDSVVVKPQLERGNVSTAYAKHLSDLSDVNLKKYEKNLLPYPYSSKAQLTVSGVTFSAAADGTVTASGTNTGTGAAQYWIADLNAGFTLPKAKYMFSGNPAGTQDNTYYLQLMAAKSGTVVRNYRIRTGAPIEVDLTGVDYDRIAVKVCVDAGVTANSVVFRPQLESGSVKTAFESPAMPETYTVGTDGSVETISANEGTTTLATDNDGAILNTKYSRDLSAAFTEIQNAIIALGGSF